MKEAVTINNDTQWIYIRGNENAPLLLFLHGGPGITNGIYLDEPFFKGLEQHYLVVYWEQRCAGKSFTWRHLKKPILSEQFIEDTKEMTDYLLKRFEQDKLVLFGFSYGAYVGIQAANRYPRLYSSYIAVGQPISNEASVLEGYHYLWQLVEETDNHKLRKQLKKIGSPPYHTNWQYMSYRFTLDAFGGFKFNRKTNLRKDYLLPLLSASIYSFRDKWKWVFGLFSSLLLVDIKQANLEAHHLTLKIPALFISGERDFVTPVRLIKEAMEHRNNALHHVAIIPHAAHDAHLEKPEIVLTEIVQWKEKIAQNTDKTNDLAYNLKNKQREVKP